MQSFAVPYGERGWVGSSSGVGSRRAAPYNAPPDDATTTRRQPALIAAVRTLTVPSTLMCASIAGSRHDLLTPPCAARWRIAVGFHARIAWRAGSSAMSAASRRAVSGSGRYDE